MVRSFSTAFWITVILILFDTSTKLDLGKWSLKVSRNFWLVKSRLPSLMVATESYRLCKMSSKSDFKVIFFMIAPVSSLSIRKWVMMSIIENTITKWLMRYSFLKSVITIFMSYNWMYRMMNTELIVKITKMKFWHALFLKNRSLTVMLNHLWFWRPQRY